MSGAVETAGRVPLRRVRWKQSFRIIPSRYPPIQLFERVADPADWELLAEVESLTNDRIRDEIGEIALVAPAERVSGPGASWLMASFTHIGRPSRFSDGSYGVHYVARECDTAVAETTYHMARFYAATDEAPCDVDMRVLLSPVEANFHDIRPQSARSTKLHDPDHYGDAQAFGASLRDRGSNGIVYRSVRNPGGQCVGAFRPKALKVPVQGPHFVYHWSGARIDRYFDYGSDTWVDL